MPHPADDDCPDRPSNWKFIYKEDNIKKILKILHAALPAVSEINDTIKRSQGSWNVDDEPVEGWGLGREVVPRPLSILKSQAASLKRLGMRVDTEGEVEPCPLLRETMGPACWITDQALVEAWRAFETIDSEWLANESWRDGLIGGPWFQVEEGIEFAIGGLDSFMQILTGEYRPRAQGTGTPTGPVKWRLTVCQRDCIEIVREAGRRLTTDEVCQLLERTGKLHGYSTIKNALAFLCKLGHLNNRRDGNPRGFGLPDWS
jgi:hypothetical protein